MNSSGLEINNIRIEELLKAAIVTATEALRFYTELLEGVSSEEQRQKLKKITDLKTKHKATLEGLYVMVTLEKPEGLPPKGVVSFEEIDAEGEIERRLAAVIGVEEKICHYYQELSKRTDDRELRHLLVTLAEEERSLVELLWELTATGPSRGVAKPRLV
jgi:rubrerythrin